MGTTVKNLLEKNGFTCNAAARTAIAECVSLPKPNELDLKDWAPVIEYAIEVGGAPHGTEYAYKNAQDGISVAKVFDLYEIPQGLVNPLLVCLSGYMPAAIYTLEALRAYEVKYGEKLPLFATGQGGNKGLFAQVFNREDGLMVQTEAEAYMRMMEKVIDPAAVRQYQRRVADTDANGNFDEMYQLAKSEGWKEVTFIICSGQPWYTKRLLAEGMLQFGKSEYADVKINLVVLDCPLTLESITPEGHLSELMLGYIAASLGPLTKDTTSLEAPDFSKERYLLPGVAEADWSVFEELITYYSNMGWPNYQELLYGVDHKTAVYNVIMADLRARASFMPVTYEDAVRSDVNDYKLCIKENSRKKYFPRTVYLKFGWYDGCRRHTAYDQVSYLDFQKEFERYRAWDIDFKENF